MARVAFEGEAKLSAPRAHGPPLQFVNGKNVMVLLLKEDDVLRSARLRWSMFVPERQEWHGLSFQGACQLSNGKIDMVDVYS
jgi:hypothetical protein